MADGSVWESADMWARADESSEYLIGLYRSAWWHSDESITQPAPDATRHRHLAGIPPWQQMDVAYTALGFATVALDGRGNPGPGIEDPVTALPQLAERHPLDRVGVARCVLRTGGSARRSCVPVRRPGSAGWPFPRGLPRSRCGRRPR
ncbi:hypothetical protein GCM10022222_02470 [Amycolatopsis ultiminotia]|uniref:Uncharacterized protein n=1 Tax=Amycolatopsis ultiminotia TaxID=543629 RepID=A0ABP6UYX5_9PSEU